MIIYLRNDWQLEGWIYSFDSVFVEAVMFVSKIFQGAVKLESVSQNLTEV